MAAQKQAPTQHIGQKRSKNKFKPGLANAIAQPPVCGTAKRGQTIPEGNAPDNTQVSGKRAPAAAGPSVPQSQNRRHAASTAGGAALVGGAGAAAGANPSEKPSRNKFKQHAGDPSTAADLDTGGLKAGGTAGPSASHQAAAAENGAKPKKRSRNKFKQHADGIEAAAAISTVTVNDGQLAGTFASQAPVTDQATAAETGVSSKQSRKRSKNKFKLQIEAQPLAAAAAEGSHPSTGAPPRSNGNASERLQPHAAGLEGVRGVQGQLGVSGRASGGVHGRAAGPGSPAGQAGQRSGQRTVKPAAAGLQLAGHKRAPGEAGLPEHAAAEAKQKKRRRKPKGDTLPARVGGVREGPAKPDAQASLVPTMVAPPQKGTAGSANWAALKATLGGGSGQRKRRRPAPSEGGNAAERRPERLSDLEGLTPVLAVDCEMVGVGADGTRSSLARVCVVNSAGNVLLDEHVAQRERVTDYRTRFSGIRPSDLVGALSLEDVQRRVADMFKSRIVVGHAITNDLTALLLSHPRKAIRDTARFPPLMRATAPGRRPKPRALRQLAAEHLGLLIQEGEHSPLDDARAALYLYQKHRKARPAPGPLLKEWEMHIERGTVSHLKAPGAVQQQQPGSKKGAKTLEELAAADDMVDL